VPGGQQTRGEQVKRAVGHCTKRLFSIEASGQQAKRAARQVGGWTGEQQGKLSTGQVGNTGSRSIDMELSHRDKTRVQMPAKMFPHLKLIC
jgi:hypothetical protein